MDLKSGYKQTEVGTIPEDWLVGRASDLVHDMKSGLSRRLQSRDIGIPVLTSGNIQANKLVTDELKYWYLVDPQGANTGDYVLNDGDILLCFINSIAQIGKPCIFRDIGRPAIYTTNIFRIVVSEQTVPEFACFLFSASTFQKAIQEIVKPAVNQASFTKPDFLQIRVPLPPTKHEQKAIAAVLSDADAHIDALDQLIAKKRLIKQGAMQELLSGRRRLPGLEGEWAKTTLRELEAGGSVKLNRGKVISQLDIASNPGPYAIYSSSVHHQGLFGHYGDFMFDEELITWSIDGGGHFFHRPRHRFSVTNVCGYMRVLSANISCRFLAYELQQLHTNQFFDYTLKAHPSVIRDQYDVELPSYREQLAIAAVLSDMDAEIAALEAKRDKAKQLKQGLMQQLLTGRIRLV